MVKHRRFVNPGRRKRNAKRQRANVRKKNAGRSKYGSLEAKRYHKSALQGKRRKKNVSHIVVIRRKNPSKKRRYSRRRKSNPRKVVIVNMARRRRRTANKGRRHRNVVYQGRIKRGFYKYSNPGRRRASNPGMYRRHKHHNVRQYSRRRNPGMFSGTMGKVLGVVGGLAVTKLLMGFVPASLNSGVLGYLTTGVVAVAQGKLIGKVSKSAALGEDMMVGGLAYLAARILNDFLPSIGGYTGISGMGLIGGSSFYVPQVPMGGNMGRFVTPSAVSGAIVASAPPPSVKTAGVGILRRTGRLM